MISVHTIIIAPWWLHAQSKLSQWYTWCAQVITVDYSSLCKSKHAWWDLCMNWKHLHGNAVNCQISLICMCRLKICSMVFALQSSLVSFCVCEMKKDCRYTLVWNFLCTEQFLSFLFSFNFLFYYSWCCIYDLIFNSLKEISPDWGKNRWNIANITFCYVFDKFSGLFQL